MTDPPQNPPPGWYPTPDGQQGYWDGDQWTNDSVVPAPSLLAPLQERRGGAVKWVLLAVGLILVVGGGWCVALVASAGGEACEPGAVRAFDSLPPFPGVEVDLQGSPGIGCTDTVQPADPDAFIAHYEREMRNAGWTVVRDGDGFFAAGPAGGVRIDRYEGNDVAVFLPSAADFAPEGR